WAQRYVAAARGGGFAGVELGRDRESQAGGADHEGAAAEIGIANGDRHGSALLRDALDGADDARIGAAATDIGRHVLDDLRARRFRIVRQQVGGAHDLARLAVAALRHLLGEPGLLYRVRRVG